MKAICKAKREHGIEVQDIPIPEIELDEVLLKIKASTICGSDVHYYEWPPEVFYKGAPFSLGPWYDRIPCIFGHQFSGEVVDVGKDVKGIEEGDRLVGIGRGYAEYCVMSTTLMDRFGGIKSLEIPDNVSYEAAALVEPLAFTLYTVEQSRFKSGQVGVVLGPGQVGLFIGQHLKARGASNVMITGLGVDKNRLAVAGKLGIDVTVNIEEEDPVKRLMELTDGRRVEVVFEACGSSKAFNQAIKMVQKGGELLAVASTVTEKITISYTDLVSLALTIKGIHANPYDVRTFPSTWERVLRMLSRGMLVAEPIISHKLPLNRAVEAFELMRTKEAVMVCFVP